MAEYPADFLIQALFRPAGMLAAQSRRFHFARRPVKPLRQTKPPRSTHRAPRNDLFGTGLFIPPALFNHAPKEGSAQLASSIFNHEIHEKFHKTMRSYSSLG
jgi:hypothetical protein